MISVFAESMRWIGFARERVRSVSDRDRIVRMFRAVRSLDELDLAIDELCRVDWHRPAVYGMDYVKGIKS